jgi:rhodanese-related sulfurtransferase
VSDDLADLPDLSVDEVEQRLGTPGFFVFDNNSQGRWKRSHVPTAQWLDPYDFAESELPPDKQATLVFYCSGPG